MPVKIILADDHPLFLDGLVTLLRREKDFDVSATFTEGAALIDHLKKNTCDICIMDINMPVKDGIESVKNLRAMGNKSKVIMLTTHNDIEMIRALVSFDISGYVLKNSTGEELVGAIRKVIDGGKWFSPEVQQAMAEDFANPQKRREEIVLTPREIEIVQLLAKEHTNEQIADKLFISYRTVETHRKNIMQKTGARNLAGLITYAIAQGIVK